MGPIVGCRHFSGYKPCRKNSVCDPSCPSIDIPRVNILVVHLGAQGAVLRSTALLRAIKRKYPSSRIFWITEKPMEQLLSGHSMIDRVTSTSYQELLELQSLEFDVAFVIDKSLLATGIVKQFQVEQVYGFLADPQSGAILPANSEAMELWRLGLSDEQKFFKNTKPETQLVHEALDLGPWQRDEYWVEMTNQEKSEARRRRAHWSLNPNQPVIGINTGCGPLMPAKKMTVEAHRTLIQALANLGYSNLVLLGGPADESRNQHIAHALPVQNSSTSCGVRDGLISVDACDLVVTGDSFGMHMAIALKKFVVAWFGPSCPQEIDLYERGVKVLSPVGCSPCWKKDCQQEIMCYDQVRLGDLLEAIEKGVNFWQSPSYLSRRPSLEISS